ncbi:MAG: ABC transporter ATP-binding protein [Chloroflexota bacterium]
MLAIKGLQVGFGSQTVLHDINLHVEDNAIMCLLGPSGCGKTTLLRTIAGLEQPQAGKVHLGGRDLVGVPTHRRGLGLMFQDFALFPHLDVVHNVTFGLRMQGQSHQAGLARAREVLALVGMGAYETRDVTQLSGGEKQRVALARSLAPNPRLLMLDEPFGSLDAALRDRLLVDLRRIIKDVGLTAVYVTHDQQEAYAIADRIAVMNAGRIEQVAAPQTLYQRPATVFAARFLGLTNIVSVHDETADGLITPLGTLPRPHGWGPDCGALLLHPDGLMLDAGGQLRGTVVERVFQGGRYRLQVELADDQVFMLTAPARLNDVPDVGDETRLDYDPAALVGLRGTL